ncbi:hypothetical protein GN244_ATG14074 [Phytophthora infestans]|uniref:Uncharacterized protein n=1 Tax=Phytophthora infestans TaxID=4787 RepID=A0A833SIK0_PHYIN|nr:hypothetical protein GN244_ATG14074 [Phytophthora infestans]KAF4139187.1 hypothetical protein GN958_ATG11547 [Phytophthora infestans]
MRHPSLLLMNIWRLHQRREEGYTTHVMDDAAAGEYLTVLHRFEDCTTNALAGAVKSRNFEMVLFLRFLYHTHFMDTPAADDK